jgi:hypothetical protein
MPRYSGVKDMKACESLMNAREGEERVSETKERDYCSQPILRNAIHMCKEGKVTSCNSLLAS